MSGSIDSLLKYASCRPKYPDSGFRVQFGNSYVFAAKPTSPPQRTFTITLNGKRAYVQSDGVTPDSNSALEENILNLVSFYAAHELWDSFTYTDPLLGAMSVKFNKPLELPDVTPGGNGVYPAITLELIEQP